MALQFASMTLGTASVLSCEVLAATPGHEPTNEWAAEKHKAKLPARFALTMRMTRPLVELRTNLDRHELLDLLGDRTPLGLRLAALTNRTALTLTAPNVRHERRLWAGAASSKTSARWRG